MAFPYSCCSRYYPASIDYAVALERVLTRDPASRINGGDKHQHTALGSSLMALDRWPLGRCPRWALLSKRPLVSNALPLTLIRDHASAQLPADACETVREPSLS
jgi:hypothetical protein